MAAELEEEVEDELRELAERRGKGRGHAWRWSYRALKADVDLIASLDAAHGGEGTSGRWTVQERALVNQLRSLRSLFRRLAMKKTFDELKNRAGAS